MNAKLTLAALSVAVVVGLGPASAGAHTESDVIAVPAGAEATIKLKPTHGCDGSPTTEVAISVPVEGATAGEVDGWTATATPGSKGTTVLEWKGGSLPADATGEFPVHFTPPESVGELLLFPAIQYCENGEELSWISGDPHADRPAPRVLILAAGSEPAATIDEVPRDAPGRARLEEIVDVDDPSATTTTVTTGATTSTTAAPAATTAPATTDPASKADGEQDDDGSNTAMTVGGLALVLVVITAGAVALRRRNQA